MKENIPSISLLRVFEKVYIYQSYYCAAEILKINHSTVSRHITSLEGEIGQKLFEKHNGKLKPTESAVILFNAVHTAFLKIENAIEDITDSAQNNLKILSPAFFTHQWLTNHAEDLRKYLKKENITIDCGYLKSSNQQYDIEICFNEMSLSKSNFIIDYCKISAFISPQYAALEDKNFIIFKQPGFDFGEKWLKLWIRENPQFIKHKIIFSNDYGWILSAVISGAGIGFFEEHLICNHIKSGKLVKLSNTKIDTGYCYYSKCNDNEINTLFQAYVQKNYAKEENEDDN